ncbi:MAG: Crp/Fnr family transcriptional regulator [Clostridia bacterium]|nr:Crp/Fnr family transcriptional regulator [Clostridia bacterium]
MQYIPISERHIQAVASCKLFKNIPFNTIGAFVYTHCEVIRVEKDESVPHFDSKDNRTVCILATGSAVVFSKKDHNFILRYISVGDAVGVAAVFADTPFESDAVSPLEAVEYVLLSRPAIDSLFHGEFSNIAIPNYILYLADRIAFLNSRLNVEELKYCDKKVAFYLKCLANERTEFDLEMTICDLSVLLDLGRASLYRGLNTLEELGLIERHRNKIHILDVEALKAYH